jgi:hypothetical protein
MSAEFPVTQELRRGNYGLILSLETPFQEISVGRQQILQSELAERAFEDSFLYSQPNSIST